MPRRLVKIAATAGGMLLLVGAVALRRSLRLAHRTAKNYPAAESLITQPVMDVYVERVNDRLLSIVWTIKASHVTIYAGDDPSRIDRSRPLAVIENGDQQVIVDELNIPRTYYAVDFEHDGQVHTRITAERILKIDGAFNFRDIGGYPTRDGRYVKWGLVYRSGALGGLTDDGVRALEALNIKLVCDLRGADEIERYPDRLPTNPAPQVVKLPVVDIGTPFKRVATVVANMGHVDAMLLKGYTETLIDKNPQVLVGSISRLADAANLPAIVHCAAGKDRTGATVALLLLVLGVSEEIVLADYSLSNLHYDDFRVMVEPQIQPLRRVGITVDDLQPVLVANPKILKQTLQHIRERYGSVEQYLQAAGVSAVELEQLKTHLLE